MDRNGDKKDYNEPEWTCQKVVKTKLTLQGVLNRAWSGGRDDDINLFPKKLPKFLFHLTRQKCNKFVK